MFNVDVELRSILKSHGFNIAADNIDLRGPKKKIRTMIDSWKNFPKSMTIFPATLTKKIYNEETHEYTIAKV